MKTFRLTMVAMLAVAALSVSCKSQYEALLQSSDVDAKYAAAFQYFDAGKYTKSAQLFESLSMQVSGTAKEDTVLYYWGLSNYNYKDYYTAETNFDRFCTNFPRSPFTPDARFLRIDCLYRETLRWELDQSPTTKALSEIASYLREYPLGGHIPDCERMIKDLNLRLDTKAYEAARLYYKMEDYLAAHVAFVNVLKDDSDNIYREDILYYIALSSYKYAEMSIEARKKERFMVFVDDYLNFVGEYPESAYRKELDNLYRKVKMKLSKKKENFCLDNDYNCSLFPDCYYKQLRRKEEELKKKCQHFLNFKMNFHKLNGQKSFQKF